MWLGCCNVLMCHALMVNGPKTVDFFDIYFCFVKMFGRKFSRPISISRLVTVYIVYIVRDKNNIFIDVRDKKFGQFREV
jgi:hypothetical protein